MAEVRWDNLVNVVAFVFEVDQRLGIYYAHQDALALVASLRDPGNRTDSPDSRLQSGSLALTLDPVLMIVPQDALHSVRGFHIGGQPQ